MNQNRNDSATTLLDGRGLAPWLSRVAAAAPGVRVFIPNAVSPYVFFVARIVVLCTLGALFFLAILLAGVIELYVKLEPEIALALSVISLVLPLVLFVIDRSLAKRMAIAIRIGTISQALVDSRAPVLLLRNFGSDDAILAVESSEAFSTLREFSRSNRLELELAKELDRLGPLVAVGVPSDNNVVLGALRIYPAAEHWQRVVGCLVEDAQLIIIQLGRTLVEASHPAFAATSEHIRLVGRVSEAGERILVSCCRAAILTSGVLKEMELALAKCAVNKLVLLSADDDGARLEDRCFDGLIAEAPSDIRKRLPPSAREYRYIVLSKPGSASCVGHDPKRERRYATQFAEDARAMLGVVERPEPNVNADIERRSWVHSLDTLEKRAGRVFLIAALCVVAAIPLSGRLSLWTGVLGWMLARNLFRKGEAVSSR